MSFSLVYNVDGCGMRLQRWPEPQQEQEKEKEEEDKNNKEFENETNI
jgi:hypothetical protein